MSAYFSVRVRSSDRELEFASRALSHARFQTDEIMRKLSAGLVTVDYAGKIVLFNRAAEMILETPEKTVKGKDYRRVLSGRTVELGRELRMVLDNGVGRPRAEVEIERLDGTFMPLGVSTATISGGEDGALGVIAIFQDISQTKALQEKVRRNDRLAAVGELSASIAHEIRNPLAAIAGSAQELAKERREGESRFSSEGDRLLELIIKESARLNRILGDFLSYARIGRIAYNKVDLCHVVVEALEMIRQHPSYNLDIEVSFLSTQSVIYVVGDEDQMKQIVFNLVLNAFEALGSVCSASKKIEIAVLKLPEGGRTLLSIHDNGPGIPQKALSKIFTPFYSTRNSGTGLGLAIVYRLSESMKVSLDVESSEGSGATFYLKFRNYLESGVSPIDQVAKTNPYPITAPE
ncbi:MAG: PAS domain S-box protein [candidate division Zixibacteria bacterium]|nr:PAS domain S-box protein [candidate division Zixibacteria bacterium]